MLNYSQRENDILVRFKKRPLGTIERTGRLWAYLPRACDRAIRWEFGSLQEAKNFLEEPSRITLTRY
jgi:hypothetical protein